MYAKCIKGHVLVDANDWILCENLPSPESKCWKEGGETLFSLMARKRREQVGDREDVERDDAGLAAGRVGGRRDPGEQDSGHPAFGQGIGQITGSGKVVGNAPQQHGSRPSSSSRVLRRLFS